MWHFQSLTSHLCKKVVLAAKEMITWKEEVSAAVRARTEKKGSPSLTQKSTLMLSPFFVSKTSLCLNSCFCIFERQNGFECFNVQFLCNNTRFDTILHILSLFLTCHPRHYTSNIICYSEKVGHCGGIQKLVLYRRKAWTCKGTELWNWQITQCIT